MTTQPGDHTAAGKAGHGHLRASHADREQVIGTLKAAFVQGMLGKDEFDLRVGQAFTSRTCADLAAVTADLPAGLAAAQPLRPATPLRGTWPAWCSRHWRALALVGCGVIPLALWVGVISTDSNGFWAAFFTALFAAMFTAGGILATAPEQKRARGRLPQGPAPGMAGQAAQFPPSASPGGQLPPADPGQQQPAVAAPRRRSRPLLPVWRARVSVPCVR